MLPFPLKMCYVHFASFTLLKQGCVWNSIYILQSRYVIQCVWNWMYHLTNLRSCFLIKPKVVLKFILSLVCPGTCGATVQMYERLQWVFDSAVQTDRQMPPLVWMFDSDPPQSSAVRPIEHSNNIQLWEILGKKQMLLCKGDQMSQWITSV